MHNDEHLMKVSQPINQPTNYRASMRYRLMALVGLLVAIAFGWTLAARHGRGQGLAYDALFFFLVMIGFTFWSLYQALGRVELADRELTLRMPLSAPRTIEYRQLFSATENGRVGGRSVSLVYHPLRADGLLDLDDARSMTLPEVEGQDELLA